MTTNGQNIYQAMQTAIKSVEASAHPINKIAATLILANGNTITSPNIWLPELAPHGSTQKIGECSPTIHAEVAAIMDAIKHGQTTNNADLYLTDPPCPNCVKMLIEAGIKNIYIDSKGFRKDWYARRKSDFKAYSLMIAAAAGVRVHIVKRFKASQNAKARLINPNALNQSPQSDPIHICENTNLNTASLEMQKLWGDQAPFIVVKAGKKIVAFQETTISEKSSLHDAQDKYNLITRPINHMIASCAKYGLKPAPPIIASHIPTARELVNLFGLTRHVWNDTQINIKILNTTPATPKQTKGHEALLLLNQYGLVEND